LPAFLLYHLPYFTSKARMSRIVTCGGRGKSTTKPPRLHKFIAEGKIPQGEEKANSILRQPTPHTCKIHGRTFAPATRPRPFSAAAGRRDISSRRSQCTGRREYSCRR